MRKIEIKFTYDADKYAATKRYLEKKNVNLVTELELTIGRFYEKYVPPAVREFIELNASDTEPEAPPKQKKIKSATENLKPAAVKASPEIITPWSDHPADNKNTESTNVPPENIFPKTEHSAGNLMAGSVVTPTENIVPNAGINHPADKINAESMNTPPIISPVKVERPTDTGSAGAAKLSPDNTQIRDGRLSASTLNDVPRAPFENLLLEPWKRKNTL